MPLLLSWRIQPLVACPLQGMKVPSRSLKCTREIAWHHSQPFALYAYNTRRTIKQKWVACTRGGQLFNFNIHRWTFWALPWPWMARVVILSVYFSRLFVHRISEGHANILEHTFCRYANGFSYTTWTKEHFGKFLAIKWGAFSLTWRQYLPSGVPPI